MHSNFESIIWILLLSFGALHSILVAVFFFLQNQGKKSANILLGTLLILLGLLILEFVLNLLGVTARFPHLISVTFPLWFLVGPIYYFYFLINIKEDFKFDFVNLSHLIPFIIVILINTPFYILSSEEKINIISSSKLFDTKWILNIIFQTIYFLQTVIYLLKTKSLLKKYSKNFELSSSNNSLIQIRWYSFLIKSMLVFLIIDSLFFYPIFILNIHFPSASFGSAFLLSIFTVLVAYIGLFKSDEIFPIIKLEKPKYSKSSLRDDEIIALSEKLIEVMDNRKIYKSKNLSLSELAELLETTPNKLSQVINQKFDKSFYDFINGYRVKEAKILLKDDKYINYTIESIGDEAGFNSRASFYRIFKQYEKKTPKQFISE